MTGRRRTCRCLRLGKNDQLYSIDEVCRLEDRLFRIINNDFVNQYKGVVYDSFNDFSILFSNENLSIIDKAISNTYNNDNRLRELKTLQWIFQSSLVDYNKDVKDFEKRIPNALYNDFNDLVALENNLSRKYGYKNYVNLYIKEHMIDKWLVFLKKTIIEKNNISLLKSIPEIEVSNDLNSYINEISKSMSIENLPIEIIDIDYKKGDYTFYTCENNFPIYLQKQDGIHRLNSFMHEYGHCLHFKYNTGSMWSKYLTNDFSEELPSFFFQRLCYSNEWFDKFSPNSSKEARSIIQQMVNIDKNMLYQRMAISVIYVFDKYISLNDPWINDFVLGNLSLNSYLSLIDPKNLFIGLMYCFGIYVSEFLFCKTTEVLGSVMNKQVGTAFIKHILEPGCQKSPKEMVYGYCEDIGIHSVDQDVADLIDLMN